LFVRVLVIGLDSEPPRLWDQLADRMPRIAAMRRSGVFRPLRSTDPPITIPAWMSMLSGRDPGELGVYGFRNRPTRDYATQRTASARSVRFPRVWDVLGEHGLSSAVVGVPGTYPPRLARGVMVGDFLTPGEAPVTYPESFGRTLARVAPGYAVDAVGHRGADPAVLRDSCLAMTRARFALADHLVAEGAHDLVMVHEIGLDRIHHGFWHHFDPDHPRYEPDSPFADVVGDYHALLDGLVGGVVDRALDRDPETVVFIVSDHGSQAMRGGVFLNDWLRREGYLALTEEPAPGDRLDLSKVDFAQSRAWAEGGYYGRLYLNVAGREPQGIVPPEHAAALLREIAAGLEGLACGARVLEPRHVYRAVNGVAPDLLVYLGDLAWRALATVGHEDVYTLENDTGPDGANHDPWGVFLAFAPAADLSEPAADEASILDVAATLLAPFSLAHAVPGRPILEVRYR
jgi:predicted AlkP superfamily phosphohydrolase/phosphomutase